MKNPPNPSRGYGFGTGISELTHTRTHHTCTRVPVWVCKPVTGTKDCPILAGVMISLLAVKHAMPKRNEKIWNVECK